MHILEQFANSRTIIIFNLPKLMLNLLTFYKTRTTLFFTLTNVIDLVKKEVEDCIFALHCFANSVGKTVYPQTTEGGRCRSAYFGRSRSRYRAVSRRSDSVYQCLSPLSLNAIEFHANCFSYPNS